MFLPKCVYFWHIFGVLMTKCVYSCPNEYIFVLGEWFSVGSFTGSKMSVSGRRAEKMVGDVVFLASSALFHYFRQENHVQMCIFSLKCVYL